MSYNSAQKVKPNSNIYCNRPQLCGIIAFHMFSLGMLYNMRSRCKAFMFLNIMLHGKISVRIKIGITFIFRFHRRPIQLVVFVPVGLSSFLRHPRQVLLGVQVCSVARLGQLTAGMISAQAGGQMSQERRKAYRNKHN